MRSRLLVKSAGGLSLPKITSQQGMLPRVKDLIKNKPLVTGSAGVKNVGPLMKPHIPHSNNNIQKFASLNRISLLEKVAEILSDENKQVAKTFTTQTLASLPAHVIGGAIGSSVGDKYLQGFANNMNSNMNSLTSRARANLRVSGDLGKKISKGLTLGKGSGKALGVGLGMAAAGGVADLWALKHSLKGKINKNE